MKKRLNLIIFLFFIAIIPVSSMNFIDNSGVEDVFQKNKASGTIVIYDMKNDKYIVHNRKRAEKEFPPASTFKIPNTLIGFSLGVIEDPDKIYYRYNGEKMFLKSWEKDVSIREAMRVSSVPAYQKLAREIGLERMKESLKKIEYGNMEIGKRVDRFWIDGPLKIDAFQQVEFLRQLVNLELPFSKEAQKKTKELLLLEKRKNYSLYGKTGWLIKDFNPNLGWFMGWVDYEGDTYIFALNMDIKNSSQLYKRELMVKKSLETLGLKFEK
ncbi:MAG: class D beta-lactamase [Fusobacteriaceae bacterium]